MSSDGGSNEASNGNFTSCADKKNEGGREGEREGVG